MSAINIILGLVIVCLIFFVIKSFLKRKVGFKPSAVLFFVCKDSEVQNEHQEGFVINSFDSDGFTIAWRRKK